MRILALLFAIGCGSDIAIITTEKRPQDTNAPIVEEPSDTDSPEPDTEEPSSEIINSISTPIFLKLSLKAIKVSAIVLSSL